MNRLLPALLFAALFTSTSLARAQNQEACLAASSKAQDLRDAHKLRATKSQLQICAAPSCPKVVREDCATWLGEVDRALPTIKVTAIDDAGAPLVNVKVWLDGKVVASKIDESIPADPGTHHLHFEGTTGGTSNTTVSLTEGEKDKQLSIVLSRPADATAAPVDEAPDDDLPAPTHASPLRTVGFVTLGVGAAGLVVGAIFGGLALASKGSANCDAGLCDAEPLRAAKTQALVSTIGFVAGGVLAAAGLTLVLVAPKASPAAATTPEARLRLSPLLGGGTVGAVLVGAF